MTETSRHAVSAWTPPQDRRRWGTAEGLAMREALWASGESLRTFAQRHGLQEERVRRWVRRLDGTRVGDHREARESRHEVVVRDSGVN